MNHRAGLSVPDPPSGVTSNNVYQTADSRTIGLSGYSFVHPAKTAAPKDTNRPPRLVNPIPDRRAALGVAFQYTFAANTFSDPDGNSLTYTATLRDGSSLPVWLRFNSTARTFSGIPPRDSVWSIRVIASNGQATSSDFFNLAISRPTGPSEPIAWNTEAAPYPYRVSEAQGVSVQDKLYVFGGFDIEKPCCTPTNRAYVFDPATNAWTRLAPLPAMNNTGRGGVTHSGFTTDGTDIYFAGGYTANATGTGQLYGTREVWKYTVATNTYTRLPDLPAVRSGGQLEYLNGRLHYIGGTNQARSQDVGDHYAMALTNPESGWVTLAPVPNARHHAGSVVHKGKIYFVGGQHGHDHALVTEDDVHAYDPATNKWTLVAIMPRPRGHIAEATFVWGDRIFIVGGETAHGAHVNDVTAYNPVTNTWSNFAGLPVTRSSGIATVFNGSIYYTTGSWSSLTYKGTPIQTPVPTLTFLPDTLRYTVAEGQSVAPQSTVLAASSAGTTVVTLTKSAGADWLTLPPAALDTLTFGPNQLTTSLLSPGRYAAQVTASAAGYTSRTLQINLTVTTAPADTINLKVNFQNAATGSVPAGFIRDTGLPYADRGNGYTYGWVTQRSLTDATRVPWDMSADARNRNRTGVPLEHNTFMHMQLVDAFPNRSNQERGAWEIAVPNGVYQVTVMVGDHAYDSHHRIRVEGAVLIDHFRSSAAKAYEQKSGQFTVTDGALTLDASGGYNTKINSVYLQSVNTSMPVLSQHTDLLSEPEGTLQIYPNPSDGTVTIAFTPGNTQPASVEVYSPQGILVERQTDSQHCGQVRLNQTGKLAAGVYMVSVRSASQTRQAKLIITR